MTNTDITEVKKAIEDILCTYIAGRGGCEWRNEASDRPYLFRALEIVSDWANYGDREFMIEVWGSDLYDKARRGEATPDELQSAEERWWRDYQARRASSDETVVQH